MTYQPVHDELLARSPGRERASALIARYPHVSEEETQEILRFMRSGRHVDVILLSNDNRLRSQLDGFMSDYRPHLRGWGEGMAVIVGIFVLMVAMFFAFEAFS
jgi:hypothetical protein